MINNNPKISVVMSCYNRKDYVKDSIESIINQTYRDFEFIIIDDCSTDGTCEVIESYAKKDNRIVFIKNDKNMDYNFNFRKGFEIAKGEYIARMDDDDISLPNRFEKQVEFMDKNPDITVLGTFIETFGNSCAKSWVDESDSDTLSVLMNFYNPMCHPSVMIRNSFLKKHNLNYSPDALYAEEYDLWKNIILKGGKLANLPEILLKYRIHNKQVSTKSKTSKIQYETIVNVKKEMLGRFFDKKETKKILKKLSSYPFEFNNKKNIYDIFSFLKEKNKSQELLNEKSIDYLIKKYCGNPCTMDIFFASDDKFVQHLSVAIVSILKNSLPFENFNFYILDGGITDKSKNNILSLQQIKKFNIEFIKVDDNLFKECNITDECLYISKQTYYRYIIPKLKPEIKKCIYLDCDIVVNDSLNKLWNIDLKDNYVAAVIELYNGGLEDKLRLGVNKYFNAGVLLINNELWVKDNISETLFENQVKLKNKIRWVDQDVLNYTFNNKVLLISPKYNLQQNAFYDTVFYADENDLLLSKAYPVIIHYNGYTKPWSKKCMHKLWKKYYIYLKYTSYKKNFYKYKIVRFIKKIGQIIFFSKKEGVYKRFKIVGIKFSIKDKRIEFKLNMEKHIKEIEEKILEYQKKEVLNSKYWDVSWYLSNYRYNLNKTEALEYYIKTGWKNNESPSRYLNCEYYTNKYNIKNENPLIHYLTKGRYWCYYPDNKNNFKSKCDEKYIQDYLEYKNQRVPKGVIYTCITNDYDDINEIKTYKYVNKDWDYVCFTDNKEHIEKGQIGIWEIKPLMYNESDNTRKNRWHKFHPHILFPQYSQSIYIDANINILTSNIFDIINNSESKLLVPEHFNTPCIHKEFQWALNNNIDNKDNIEKLYEIIKKSNMPINYGFTENNLIYRKHNEKDIVDLMDEWWYLLKNYAKRDQLSFVWLLWKRGIEIEDITFKNTRIDTDNFYVFDHKKSREKVLANL